MTRFEKIRAAFWVAAIALIAVMLFLGIRPAQAETWGVATIGSRHFDHSEHCERNPGLGFEHDVSDNARLIGGFYKNSPCRRTVYAGVAWTPLRFGPVRLGGLVGAGTGYDHLIAPAAAALVQIEGKNVGLNLTAVPRIDRDKPGVIGLQLKARF